MNLADLIQNHIKLVDATTRDATRLTRSDADLARPASLFDDRIKQVEARIALLESQRAATEKRFVAAIEDQKRLAEDMAKEAKVWADRSPVKTPEPVSGRPTTTGPHKQTATVRGTKR